MATSIYRWFRHHPQALGIGWAEHGRGAVAIGLTMIGAGLACLVHAVVPGWFTQTAGRTVDGLYARMRQRRAAAPDPVSWPDYEI